MIRLSRNVLFVIIYLMTSNSYAACITDSELKFVRFQPSNLAAYVPKNTVIKKRVLDSFEQYEATYSISYEGQKIFLTFAPAQLNFFYDINLEYMPLPNISDTARLLTKKCGEYICSKAYLNLGGYGSHYDDELYYTNTISYSSSTLEEKNIGDKFVNSLFSDTSDCIAAEPDSLVYNGPFEVYIPYFDANSAVIPSRYYEDDQLKHFASFVSRNNANIIIEGHTSKNEIQLANRGEDYSLSLSRQRAEEFKDFLIENYDMDPNIQVDIQAIGSTRPVAPDSNTEAVKLNHRVRAYIDLRNPEK